MTTKLNCGMIEDDCVTALRESTSFIFDDNARRDAYFTANLTLLENTAGTQTMCFVGTSAVTFNYWNGPVSPATYDPAHWVTIPVAATAANADVHYWGDPNTDLTMRARRESATGFLIYERRVAGVWVEKFRISNSITIDTAKFRFTPDEPILFPGELGLHTHKFLDSEHGNAEILRPVFLDPDGTHYLAVAALPDGRLRIAQNVEEASNDPSIPLRFRYVMFNDDAAQVRNLLAGLQGNARLPATAIDGLPAADTAVQIRDKLQTLTGTNRLDQSAVKGILTPFKVSGTGPFTLAEFQYAAYILEYTGTGNVTQVLPSVTSFREGAVVYVSNQRRGGTIQLQPYTGQTLDGSPIYVTRGSFAILTAMPAQSRWSVATYPMLADSLMSGTAIVQAIENDPTNPKIPADYIANLTGTLYRETSDAIQFDPINLTYAEIAFEHRNAVTQTMPNVVNCRDNMFVMIRNHKSDGSAITLVAANSGQSIDGVGSYDVDAGVSVLFVCMKDRNGWHKVMDFEHAAQLTHGINVDDGATSAGDVSKLNIVGGKITKIQNQDGMGEHEITVAFGPNVGVQGGNYSLVNNCHDINFYPPFEVTQGKGGPDQPAPGIAMVGINPRAYEPQHAPGMLAQLSSNVGIVGKTRGASDEHDGVLWLDNFITPAGEYIELRPEWKAYGIQDGSSDDPNVTGGTPTELIANVGFVGRAPADGLVRVYFMMKASYSDPAQYLVDAAGNVAAIERHYKAGDEFKPELLTAIVQATALQYVTLHVMHNLGSETLLVDHTQTYFCIQQRMNKYQTSVAKLEFEQRVGVTITPRVEYFGADEVTLGQYLQGAVPAGTAQPNEGIDELGEYGLHNLSTIRAEISNNTLILSSLQDICDFDIHQIEDHQTTRMVRKHNVRYDVAIEDKDDGWRLVLFAWTGEPDRYANLYNSRTNGVPNFNAGWTKIAETFISEDYVSGIHNASVSGIIPENASNFGVFLYPTEAQNPTTLKLKALDLSYDPPFTSFIEQAPVFDGEVHLARDERYKELRQDTQGYLALRYTLNNVTAGLPLPCGMIKKGNASIEIDTTVNRIPGSAARGGEGAIKFKADGLVNLSSTFNLWNEQDSPTTVTMWWAEVSADGQTFTELPASKASFVVPPKTTGSLFTLPAFDYAALAGARLALRGKADKADGAYLQCITDKTPMVVNTITFDELVAVTGNPTIPRLLHSELRVVAFSNVVAQTTKFTIDIPVGVEVGSHSVVGIDDKGLVTSIESAAFSYNKGTKEMTVHVGALKSGKIYITLWR